LHAASEQGHEAIIKYLLEKGVPRDVKTKKGKTALQLAKNSSIKKLLAVCPMFGLSTRGTN
jgi:ankyrin repeat protein